MIPLLVLALTVQASALDAETEDDSDEQDSYVVLRITDHRGSVRFEVLLRSRIKDRREQLDNAYEAALKSHKESKKSVSEDDGVDNPDFLFCRPKKPKSALVGWNLSREEAKMKADKLQRDHIKRREKGSLFSRD